jgi:hypothetical protein
MQLSTQDCIRRGIPIDFREFSIERNQLLLILDKPNYLEFFDRANDVKEAARSLGFTRLYVQYEDRKSGRKAYNLSLFSRL